MSTETNTPKAARFLAFAFTDYYPEGGWFDFIGAFDTIEDASAACRAKQGAENWQVVSVESLTVVATNCDGMG